MLTSCSSVSLAMLTPTFYFTLVPKFPELMSSTQQNRRRQPAPSTQLSSLGQSPGSPHRSCHTLNMSHSTSLRGACSGRRRSHYSVMLKKKKKEEDIKKLDQKPDSLRTLGRLLPQPGRRWSGMRTGSDTAPKSWNR